MARSTALGTWRLSCRRSAMVPKLGLIWVRGEVIACKNLAWDYPGV